MELPKTKQELQLHWDGQLEKITKKFNTDKKTAAQAIDIIEYITDYTVLQVTAEQSGISVPDKNQFMDVIKGLTVNSPDIEFRKRGAQIFALIDSGIKKNILSKNGILYNAGLPETMAIWEIQEDPSILERLTKNILDEKSGKPELLAIKIFASGMNRLRIRKEEELAKKAEDDKKKKAEDDRLAEIQRMEAERLAVIKRKQDEENARAAGERKKLEDARMAAVNEMKLAETPRQIKSIEESIVIMRSSIEENKKKISDLEKKIATTEKAFKDDKWRLPRVPAALQSQVRDRLAKHQDTHDELSKNIEDLKNENKNLPLKIEVAEKKLEDAKKKYEADLKGDKK